MYKKGMFAFTLVSVILGIMLAIQFKTTEANHPITDDRTPELVSRLIKLENEKDALNEEILDLQKKISYGMGNEALASELNKARQVAGLTAMQGRGLVITMNDSQKPLSPGEDPNISIIHYDDILKIINELKSAGAEAISVNDQRIIAMSEVRCAGPTILINTEKITPPFVITAIGNPDVSENSIKMRGGVAEYLQYYGIQLKYEKSPLVKVPAYTSVIKFEEARTINKE